jgi:glycosyltransferase involved in cell wall biosynthesis
LLEEAKSYCKLGIHRAPMSRLPGLGDLAGVKATHELAQRLGVDVIHCHGAKGGVYGRLAAAKIGVPSVYTPHGGSLHYWWLSASGVLFLATETYLSQKTSGFCFVCAFEQREFAGKIGLSGKPSKVAFNGLWPDEFTPAKPNADAADFLFVGEIRHLKGIDILLHAMAALPLATLAIVGDGKEQAQYESLARELGLSKRVTFAGRLPIADALKRGRIMVLPSRNESFPYVILEAAAARLPVIASAVGGIGEIVPDALLCHDRTADTLAAKMRATLAGQLAITEASEKLFAGVKSRCDARKMVVSVTDFYKTLKPELSR